MNPDIANEYRNNFTLFKQKAFYSCHSENEIMEKFNISTKKQNDKVELSVESFCSTIPKPVTDSVYKNKVKESEESSDSRSFSITSLTDSPNQIKNRNQKSKYTMTRDTQMFIDQPLLNSNVLPNSSVAHSSLSDSVGSNSKIDSSISKCDAPFSLKFEQPYKLTIFDPLEEESKKNENNLTQTSNSKTENIFSLVNESLVKPSNFINKSKTKGTFVDPFQKKSGSGSPEFVETVHSKTIIQQVLEPHTKFKSVLDKSRYSKSFPSKPLLTKMCSIDSDFQSPKKLKVDSYQSPKKFKKSEVVNLQNQKSVFGETIMPSASSLVHYFIYFSDFSL